MIRFVRHHKLIARRHERKRGVQKATVVLGSSKRMVIRFATHGIKIENRCRCCCSKQETYHRRRLHTDFVPTTTQHAGDGVLSTANNGWS